MKRALAISLILLLVPGCGSTTVTPQKPAELNFGEKLLNEADYLAYIQSTTNEYEGLVSGFLIKDGGEYYVVTAQHFKHSAETKIRKIKVWFKWHWEDFQVHEAELVGYDAHFDCAILKMKDQNFSFGGRVATLGDSSKTAVGDKVAILGAPRKRPNQVSVGKILAVNDGLKTDDGQAIAVLVHDCLSEGGNSGGPLLNEKGEVIGIHVRRSATGVERFAIPINTFKGIFEKLKRGYKYNVTEDYKEDLKILKD